MRHPNLQIGMVFEIDRGTRVLTHSPNAGYYWAYFFSPLHMMPLRTGLLGYEDRFLARFLGRCWVELESITMAFWSLKFEVFLEGIRRDFLILDDPDETFVFRSLLSATSFLTYSFSPLIPLSFLMLLLPSVWSFSLPDFCVWPRCAFLGCRVSRSWRLLLGRLHIWHFTSFCWFKKVQNLHGHLLPPSDCSLEATPLVLDTQSIDSCSEVVFFDKFRICGCSFSLFMPFAVGPEGLNSSSVSFKKKRNCTGKAWKVKYKSRVTR